jgi:uncharacterized protein YukE
MALWGQDVAEVQKLATQLSSKASEIQSIISQLSSQISSVNWQGPDATKFRSEWQSSHTAKLKAVVDALNQASQSAKKNAQDQQSASNA